MPSQVPPYNPHEIEAKWQDRWERDGLNRTDWSAHDAAGSPPHYFLLMFPYPSGPLHCGHWYMYAIPDAKARYLRMKGRRVFFPMGFDAFGLPAENAAIKHKIHPKQWTLKNIGQMRQSFRKMGASFDFGEEVVITCDPAYYKWTQWLFLELFKNGLAYRTRAPVDFCPSCNTTLAREQIIGTERVCERCETPVIKRDLDQWLFRITQYAEELLDFSGIDWPERVKTMQTNWIGRTEGADLDFALDAGGAISVFTTRADTLGGVTFLVVAPEHPLVDGITTPAQRAAVTAYVDEAKRRSEIQRLAVNQQKTGVFTGAYAKNPLSGERVPVYVGDYVLVGHGTGAVMGVPAHDQRDFDFAKVAGLPVRLVITPPEPLPEPLERAYEDPGSLVNSGEFDGLASDDAIAAITRWAEAHGTGRRSIRYRLRDWLVSRQRYWGAPIPVIHCPKCGSVGVPTDQLPVLLPDDVDFVPTGESPLKRHAGFVNASCPQCGGPAERDTDTLDTFVDSSWYWFRYLSPQLDTAFYDPKVGQGWLPVAEYAGGIEHATMHLLYARFFTKALRDIGHVDHGEPFQRLFNQGLVLGEDGEKMSKSRGNVVNPDDVVAEHGSDALRAFLMFLGPWGRGGAWSSDGIVGLPRFFQRVWRVVLEERPLATNGGGPPDAERDLRRATHKTLAAVGGDLENFAFNTAISTLMEFVNQLYDLRSAASIGPGAWKEATRTLVLMLAPIAPHLAEELWSLLGETTSVHRAAWPAVDTAAAASDTFTLVVQVNGKVRGKLDVPVGTTEPAARELAEATDFVRRALGDKSPKRVVYVPGRVINFIG